MTTKPTQHSVTLVNHLRDMASIGIDEVERTIEEVSAKIEAAFMAELAHLDELYTDQENDDTALELVQRFDKGYAKTMADPRQQPARVAPDPFGQQSGRQHQRTAHQHGPLSTRPGAPSAKVTGWLATP